MPTSALTIPQRATDGNRRTARTWPRRRNPQFRPVVTPKPPPPDGNPGYWALGRSREFTTRAAFGVRRELRQLTDASGHAWCHSEAPPLFAGLLLRGAHARWRASLTGRYLRQRNERTSLYLGLFSLMAAAPVNGERAYQIDWFAWSNSAKSRAHPALWLVVSSPISWPS